MNNLKIQYGVINRNVVDITELALSNCVKNGIMYIPSGDIRRSELFNTDPLQYVLKNIYFTFTSGTSGTSSVSIFDHTKEILYDLSEGVFYMDTIPDFVNAIYPLVVHKRELVAIQQNLKLYFGTFIDEYPEQLMTVTYLTGNEKVLEIGSNIGRNSLIIASILSKGTNGTKNFVTLESDPDYFSELTQNVNVNGFQGNVYLENSALSSVPLIQQGWQTIQSDVLLDNYKQVNVITLDQLKAKYNIAFDTLILDCEGSFYHILQQFPEILNGIKLIIMENDYTDANQFNYVVNTLRSKNFEVVYNEEGGWGACYPNFYQVWKLIN